MHSYRSYLPGILRAASFGVMLGFALLSLRADDAPKSQAGTAQPEARQAFAAMCAGCHGLDGSGTQRAPSIAAGSRILKLSPDEIYRIVSDGVPGTGMPGFRSIGDARIKMLVQYVQQLQASDTSAPLPGDPARGKQLFFGAGGCSSCHMVHGEGGFIAPDLSDYAASHAGDQIRSAITTPAARTPAARQVRAVANDGKEYSGVIRNEDNFSLQLLSADGKFYFLSKSDLRRVERDSKSLMPTDYGSKLTSEQLNDLVSYLASISRASRSAPVKDKDSDDD
jgi:cytochrome c oxidase cbb3-type subunit 3